MDNLLDYFVEVFQTKTEINQIKLFIILNFYFDREKHSLPVNKLNYYILEYYENHPQETINDLNYVYELTDNIIEFFACYYHNRINELLYSKFFQKLLVKNKFKAATNVRSFLQYYNKTNNYLDFSLLRVLVSYEKSCLLYLNPENKLTDEEVLGFVNDNLYAVCFLNDISDNVVNKMKIVIKDSIFRFIESNVYWNNIDPEKLMNNFYYFFTKYCSSDRNRNKITRNLYYNKSKINPALTLNKKMKTKFRKNINNILKNC